MKYYIKLSCNTYINHICKKRLFSWMKGTKIADDHLLYVLTTPDLVKEFLTIPRDTDEKQQAKLVKTKNHSYRNILKGTLVCHDYVLTRYFFCYCQVYPIKYMPSQCPLLCR